MKTLRPTGVRKSIARLVLPSILLLGFLFLGLYIIDLSAGLSLLNLAASLCMLVGVVGSAIWYKVAYDCVIEWLDWDTAFDSGS